MPKYLTVTQYGQYGDYPMSADITPLLLARTISRAETDIDTYMEFDLKLGGFEAHTAFLQAAWNGESRKTRLPNFPVTIRRALQYRIQTSTQTANNAPFVATINPGDVAYNLFDRYIEIVPLQSITYAMTPVLVQLGLNPSLVLLDYEAGFYLPFWGEVLINGGDNRTYYAARGFWALSYTQAQSIQPQIVPPIPPTVYANGITVSTGVSWNATEGSITFAAERAPADVVSLDYTATIPDVVRDACIDQVSYLLGQRALNKAGMSGVDYIRSGVQQIKRSDASEKGLCQRAMDKLQGYKPIALA
jgi:hypothetical protein